MKKIPIRLLSLIVALLLALSAAAALSSCANSGQGDDTTAPQAITNSDVTTAAEETDYQVMDEAPQQQAPARKPAAKKGTDDEQKAKFVAMMGELEAQAPEAYAQALKAMNIDSLDKVQPNMRQIVYKSAQQAVTAEEANEQFNNDEADNG